MVHTMGRDVAAGSSRATREFVGRIGVRVRELRKRRGWSVQQLAEAAGLSRRMLTDIELGRANPSLATVDRVAHALGTDFAALALPPDATVNAEVEGTLVWQATDGSQALLLGATQHPTAELWRWTLNPGGRYEAEPNRRGAQAVHHVLSGVLTLDAETGPQALGPGRSAVLATDQSHTYRNEEGEPAVFLVVVTGA